MPITPPNIPTWTFEGRGQRAQRQQQQFQQLVQEIKPHIDAGDYATAQQIIAQRVPEAAPKPKPSGGGGLFGKLGDIAGGVGDFATGAVGKAGTALDVPGQAVETTGALLLGAGGSDHWSPGGILSGLGHELTQNPITSIENAHAASGRFDRLLAENGIAGFNPKIGGIPLIYSGFKTLANPLSYTGALGAESLGAGLLTAGREAGIAAGAGIGAQAAAKGLGVDEQYLPAVNLVGGLAGGKVLSSPRGRALLGEASGLAEMQRAGAVPGAGMVRNIPIGTRLFHGTQAEIGPEGLRPSGTGDIGPGAYVTTNPATASNYAWGATSDFAHLNPDSAGAQVLPVTPRRSLKLLRADKQLSTSDSRAIRKALVDVTGRPAPAGPWDYYGNGMSVLNALRRLAPDDEDAFAQQVLSRAGYDGTYQNTAGMTNPEWGRPFAEGRRSDEAAVFDPGELQSTIAGGSTVPDILNLPGLQPTPLSRLDRIGNAIKRALGTGVEEDTIATPAMRERAKLRPVVESQAALVGTRAADIARAFETDAQGRIQSLEGAPTIQDVAAQLPRYKPFLSREQAAAMNQLAHQIAPYRELLARAGVEDIGNRTDIMEGGFYLPRGRADVEGADAPVKVRTGRGGAGSRKGFEKGATFDSMAQGIDAGYQYAPFAEAMQGYARDAGNRAVDQHVANYFKTVTDEDGNLIAESPADRMDAGLKAQYGDAVGLVASLRERINTAMRRAGAARGAADELDKALTGIEERTPTNVEGMGKLGRIADRQGARAAELQKQAQAAQNDLAKARSAALRASRDAGGAAAKDRAATAVTRGAQAKLQSLEQRWSTLNDRANTLYENAPGQSSHIKVDAAGRVFTDVEGLTKQLDDLAAEYDSLVGQAAGMDKPINKQKAAIGKAEGKGDQAYLDRGIKEIQAREASRNLREQERTARKQAADKASGQAVERAVKEFSTAIPDDVDKIRYLQHAIDASARRINALRERGSGWDAQADNLQYELQAAQTRLDQLKPQYQAAVEKARQVPRDQGAIGFSQLNGLSFPEAVANVANKYLAAEKPATGSGAAAVNTVKAFNNLMRGLRASADVSFMGIQGLIGATRDPRGYGRALATAFKSMADPHALSAYIQDFNKRAAAAGNLDARTWAQHGLHIGGADTEFSIGRGLSGKLSGLATGDTPGVKLNPLRGSNRAFGYFGDSFRLDLADTILSHAKATGLDVSDPANLAEIADAANRATGWSRNVLGGDMGQLATFAPRFMQSQLEMIANLGAKGIAGSEARWMMTSMLGTAVGITVLANEASGRPIDYKELLDPRSPNFMRFRVAGQDVSLLGPWDSLLKGVMNTAQGDPGYMLRSKASPAISTAWDVLSGKDFMGEDTHTLGYAGRSVLPFAVSDLGQKPLPATAIGLTGAKASPMTPKEQLDAIAQTITDPETGAPNRKGFYDSTPAVQKAIKEQHPDLWARAVERGSQQRQRAEEIKQETIQQQAGDDALLMAGKITPKQWMDRKGSRLDHQAGQMDELYRDSGGAGQNDPVLKAYYNAIDQIKAANNGVLDLDALTEFRSGLTDAQNAHIDANTGLSKSPLEQLRSKLSRAYYSLPQYRGYTADQARAINDLMTNVYSRSKAGDDVSQLRALRQLTASGQYDDTIVRGARKKIMGLLPDAPDRKRFAKAHPELALVTRQGSLTPADMAAIQKAIAA